ncbi:MAG: SPOR domain-containing protein [Bdellovibrionales bacterium]|nr:SPOR domain-containing protein [Bdellovibrionales bacterium]
MEENNKVIVFEKKEIILILLFVVGLVITSFTIGIRLGKKLTLDEAGIKPVDQKTVELKSGLEEDVEKTVEEDSKLTDEEKLKKLMEESKTRLSDELEKFSSEDKAAVPNKSVGPKSTSAMSGKFTIQLGSYPSVEEAKQFAEGFTVRGYSPIINETTINGKGTWYRVSLGLFGSVEEAKTYVKNEQSLFSGQDYVITELK